MQAADGVDVGPYVNPGAACRVRAGATRLWDAARHGSESIWCRAYFGLWHKCSVLFFGCGARTCGNSHCGPVQPQGVSGLDIGALRRAVSGNSCGLRRRPEKVALPFVSSERPGGEIGSITPEAIYIGIGGVENR